MVIFIEHQTPVAFPPSWLQDTVLSRLFFLSFPFLAYFWAMSTMRVSDYPPFPAIFFLQFLPFFSTLGAFSLCLALFLWHRWFAWVCLCLCKQGLSLLEHWQWFNPGIKVVNSGDTGGSRLQGRYQEFSPDPTWVERDFWGYKLWLPDASV